MKCRLVGHSRFPIDELYDAVSAVKSSVIVIDAMPDELVSVGLDKAGMMSYYWTMRADRFDKYELDERFVFSIDLERVRPWFELLMEKWGKVMTGPETYTVTVDEKWMEIETRGCKFSIPVTVLGPEVSFVRSEVMKLDTFARVETEQLEDMMKRMRKKGFRVVSIEKTPKFLVFRGGNEKDSSEDIYMIEFSDGVGQAKSNYLFGYLDPALRIMRKYAYNVLIEFDNNRPIRITPCESRLKSYVGFSIAPLV